jgi:hypothetical protein
MAYSRRRRCARRRVPVVTEVPRARHDDSHGHRHASGTVPFGSPTACTAAIGRPARHQLIHHGGPRVKRHQPIGPTRSAESPDGGQRSPLRMRNRPRAPATATSACFPATREGPAAASGAGVHLRFHPATPGPTLEASTRPSSRSAHKPVNDHTSCLGSTHPTIRESGQGHTDDWVLRRMPSSITGSSAVIGAPP